MELKPDKKHLEFLDWKFGIFFHFGIRSFYPGHKDWDRVYMPCAAFAPTDLNCDEWIKTAKEAGAAYTVLTTKHHDGFCLWPSDYTKYSVKYSDWKEGKGDVVAEYVAASRKYGMKVGLYYSPAQWGEESVPYENEKEYDDYFINQLGELLTNYGKIDYLWFDGCGSDGHEYDKKRILGEIMRMQPDILTYSDPDWHPTVVWMDNEDGYAPLDNPVTVDFGIFKSRKDPNVRLAGSYAIGRECPAKIRKTWFFDNNEDTVKSVDELFGMYEGSVGHGANLLLNISPDPRGRLPEADKARLLELGAKIKDSYLSPVKGFGPLTKIEDGGLFFVTEHEDKNKKWGEDKSASLINRIVIEEDIYEKDAVKEFEVYVNLPEYTSKKILVYCGKTIGARIICPIPAIKATKITLKVNKFDKEVKIKSIKAYFVK